MSDSGPLLDRAGIEEVFRRLGDRLAKRGVVADIYVFGGAAMALAYDARRATRDVDAVFKPHGIVLEEAHAMGAELGLPPWWLNKQASSYVAPGGDPSAFRSLAGSAIRSSSAIRPLVTVKLSTASGSGKVPNSRPGTPLTRTG